MSLSLLGCLQIGVLPAGIGPHRVGVYLRLMNQRRNWCTARSSARTRRGLRQCVEPPCATGIWDNEAAPPCEVIRSGLVYRSKHAPVGSSGTTPGLSIPDGSESSMDTDGRAVITELCRLDGAERWSILLTFGNLMERRRATIF